MAAHIIFDGTRYDPALDNFNIVSQQFNREGRLSTSMDLGSTVIVIGLGGIGGHVADILGSLASTTNLILFDDDIVELSNLNRTVFSYEHIGKLKVQSCGEIISRRNPSCKVIPIPKRVSEEVILELAHDREFLTSAAVIGGDTMIHIFDCRDNDYRDYDAFNVLAQKLSYYGNKKIWRAAYNGYSITIDSNPESHPVWGGAGYQVISSHGIPSRTVALLVLLMAMRWTQDPYAFYFREHIPFTFNVTELIDFIYYGTSIKKLQDVTPNLSHFVTSIMKAIHMNPESVSILSEAVNTETTIDELTHSLKTIIEEAERQ